MSDQTAGNWERLSVTSCCGDADMFSGISFTNRLAFSNNSRFSSLPNSSPVHKTFHNLSKKKKKKKKQKTKKQKRKTEQPKKKQEKTRKKKTKLNQKGHQTTPISLFIRTMAQPEKCWSCVNLCVPSFWFCSLRRFHRIFDFLDSFPSTRLSKIKLQFWIRVCSAVGLYVDSWIGCQKGSWRYEHEGLSCSTLFPNCWYQKKVELLRARFRKKKKKIKKQKKEKQSQDEPYQLWV